MKVIGRMIYSMDMVKKFGQMVHNMKEIILKVKSMAKEDMFGPMEVLMKEIG